MAKVVLLEAGQADLELVAVLPVVGELVANGEL